MWSGITTYRSILTPGMFSLDNKYLSVILPISVNCICGVNGSSRAPTPTNEMLPHIVSAFKRFCNKEIGNNIFQRGYIEHIIRDHEDYETRAKYICENPIRWYYDKLYTEE